MDLLAVEGQEHAVALAHHDQAETAACEAAQQQGVGLLVGLLRGRGGRGIPPRGVALEASLQVLQAYQQEKCPSYPMQRS